MDKEQVILVRAALQNTRYFQTLLSEPDLISNSILVRVWGFCTEFYRQHNRIPNETIVEEKLAEDSGRKAARKIVTKIFGKRASYVDEAEYEYYLDRAKGARKTRLVKATLKKVISSLREDDEEAAWDFLIDASKRLTRTDSFELIQRGTILDDKFFDWLYNRPRKIVPTSLDSLNKLLGGGFKAPETVLIQGGTGRGKSLAALDIALSAYEFYSRPKPESRIAWKPATHEDTSLKPWGKKLNILFFTIELVREIVQSRFLARRLGIGFGEINKNLDVERVKAVKRELDENPNKLELVKLPVGVNSDIIRLEVEDFVRENGQVDLIIVDPIYMTSAGEEAEADWLEKGQAMQRVVQIAQDFDCVAIVTNQLKGAKINKLVTDTDDTSQSFLYSAAANVVMNLVITKDMRERELGALQIVKATNGQLGSVYFKTDYSHMRLAKAELSREEFDARLEEEFGDGEEKDTWNPTES